MDPKKILITGIIALVALGIAYRTPSLGKLVFGQ